LNRPVTNVLFEAFGSTTSGGAAGTDASGRPVKPIQDDEALDGRGLRRHRKPPFLQGQHRMLFGDAKASLQILIAQLKAG
jgi:NAD/NADP transhydrogenase beta subunit